MTITFDHAKRDRTLAERGLDFLDARFVFDGVTVDFEDLRLTTVKTASSAAATLMVAGRHRMDLAWRGSPQHEESQ